MSKEKRTILWFDMDYEIIGSSLKSLKESGYKIKPFKRIPRKTKIKRLLHDVAAALIEPIHYEDSSGNPSRAYVKLVDFLDKNGIPVIFFTWLKKIHVTLKNKKVNIIRKLDLPDEISEKFKKILTD